jgi:predicted O-methyltransferase YrrM
MDNSLPQQYVPIGHFYSPVPSQENIERAIARSTSANYGGINLETDQQLALLERLACFYDEIPFPAEKNDQFRYAFHNPSYSWSDAIILYCMIRELKPLRIIEIGSGHTSALILDANELHFDGKIDCTFIEPYPELLLSLLRANEKERIRLIPQNLQDVEPTIFAALEANDILFVDSSHVVKAGSDCQLLFAEILPRLRPGVLVHLHDVFNGFEYPANWLREGRGWNEQYVLHAFLQFNSAFRIKLFTPHMIATNAAWFHEHMPNCFRNTGGHIWIERFDGRVAVS